MSLYAHVCKSIEFIQSALGPQESFCYVFFLFPSFRSPAPVHRSCCARFMQGATSNTWYVIRYMTFDRFKFQLVQFFNRIFQVSWMECVVFRHCAIAVDPLNHIGLRGDFRKFSKLLMGGAKAVCQSPFIF